MTIDELINQKVDERINEMVDKRLYQILERELHLKIIEIVDDIINPKEDEPEPKYKLTWIENEYIRKYFENSKYAKIIYEGRYTQEQLMCEDLQKEIYMRYMTQERK